MNNVAILSIRNFEAYQQVIDDYRSLLLYENELLLYSNEKKKSNYNRIKNEIIFLLERVIVNKNILKENTFADHEYLKTLNNKDTVISNLH
jgi:hypothetical protein